jgi:hypothetical protein
MIVSILYFYAHIRYALSVKIFFSMRNVRAIQLLKDFCSFGSLLPSFEFLRGNKKDISLGTTKLSLS